MLQCRCGTNHDWVVMSHLNGFRNSKGISPEMARNMLLTNVPHKLDPEILIISKPTMHGWIYSLPPGPRVEKIRHKMGVGHMCFFSSATKPCWFVKPI
jgi:hypothetical protein